MDIKKKPKFSFISCSKTVRDHITILSFSFGCCAFEMKIKNKINWHFARVIILDFVSFGWFQWEMNV